MILISPSLSRQRTKRGTYFLTKEAHATVDDARTIQAGAIAGGYGYGAPAPTPPSCCSGRIRSINVYCSTGFANALNHMQIFNDLSCDVKGVAAQIRLHVPRIFVLVL
jgi:hypothetical protein